MIINDKDLIFNINTLVCLPKEYIAKSKIYEYNFKYVYIFEASKESIDNLITFVQNNNVHQLLLIDYKLEYHAFIKSLKEYTHINILFTKDLASLISPYTLSIYNGIVNLIHTYQINSIGFLDINAYTIFKKMYPECYYISLDNPIEPIVFVEKIDSILILNEGFDPNHSYYNSLSAAKILNKEIHIIYIDNIIKSFINNFNIKANKISSLEEFPGNISLYINFCNSDMHKFLESMDQKILCLVGNNSIIKNNKLLKKYLVIESKDNIDEIAYKILQANEHREEIFIEYETFRKQYTEKCLNSISNFLKYTSTLNLCKDNFSTLLTIGIPVYNVEKYLSKCLDSVLKSLPKDSFEILIVNDGSTDNVEKIINRYLKSYPEIIKYIKQENHGLGNVRNIILENASGKYIASIDSDDTINENLFKDSLRFLQEDVDIILFDWLSVFNSTTNFITPGMDLQLSSINNYKKILYSTIMPSTCNKIIKKSLYTNMNLKFIEGLKFEDLGTNPIVLLEAETIKYINKPYYEYNIRNDSIMRTDIGYNMIDVINSLENRINEYVKTDFNKEEFIAYVYFWRVEESIINPLYSLPRQEREDMIKYIYNSIPNILFDLYSKNKYVNFFINRIDQETQKYIRERNINLLNGNLSYFIENVMKNNNYKILTPALILYNYDNRKNKL